jgi:hypothetical protein
MEELKDYGQEFRADLKMQYFSKDALVRLWQAASQTYIGLDGLWYSFMREKFGEQIALELDTELWLKRGGTELEVRRIREAMNIWGDDVASVLKWLQVAPGAGGIWPEFECELKDKNHGILTVKRCRPLEYFERHGETLLQKNACEVLDAKGFQRIVEHFNPNMKMTPLKLPPRKSKDGIACRWEIRLQA